MLIPHVEFSRLMPPNLAYPPALEPLRSYPGKWVFHYPVFLNTYCLAFHLGRLLYKEKPDNALVSRSLLRQDHWAPNRLLITSFKEKYQVEFFIAGEELINSLVKRDGECVYPIPFTSYQLDSVLLHRQKAVDKTRESACNINNYLELISFISSEKKRITKFYIITDVPPTAKAFVEHLRTRLGKKVKTVFEIRDYWTRQEGDMYDRTPKIYVFSAPLLRILKGVKEKGAQNKYRVINVRDDFPPFDTYVGAYLRAGMSDGLISDLTAPISQYFQDIFKLAEAVGGSPSKNLPKWWRGASERYSRAAHSARQPDPFPRNGTSPDWDDRDYLAILKRHHTVPNNRLAASLAGKPP